MKTWWGIRHLRYWRYRRTERRWARLFAKRGIAYMDGHVEQVLQDIWEGTR